MRSEHRSVTSSVAAKIALSLALLLASAGCAITPTVQSSLALADAGTAYGDAAAALLDVTRNQYVDYDSNALLAELDGVDPCTVEDLADESRASPECKESIQSFDRSHARLRNTSHSMLQLRTHAQALSAYFLALTNLAADQSGSAVEASAAGLIGQINGLNEAMGGKGALSEEQGIAYGKLANYLGEAYKARRLRDALRRDAQPIALAIDLQDRTLASNIAVLRGMAMAGAEEQYLVEVRRTFLLETIDDKDKWRAMRRDLLMRASLVEQVETLRIASQRLRAVWDDILEGRTDSASAAALFADLATALEIVHGIREADKK